MYKVSCVRSGDDAHYDRGAVLATVQEAIYCLTCDVPGSSPTNPLGGTLFDGMTVLVKPNLVKEDHPRLKDGWMIVLTHGTVIEAVCELVFRAIGPKGRVIIADAPQTDSSFDAVASRLGLGDIVEHFRLMNRRIELVDLRKEEWTRSAGVIVNRRALPGDPSGYVAFDLGQASAFVGHGAGRKYYGADYNTDEVNAHHSNGHHEYLIAGTAIDVDAIVSVPKLKTHKKAGITASLKNLIGVNGDKNWLPHHSEGRPSEGGDERPDGVGTLDERKIVTAVRSAILRMPWASSVVHGAARGLALRLFGDTEDVIRSGNWYGNDTVWRTCLDLNAIALWGRRGNALDGRTADGYLGPVRKPHLVVVDGIVMGEGSGPMNPDAVNAGLILYGDNPGAVDAACATVMGFDCDRIPIIANAFRSFGYRISQGAWRDVELVGNCDGLRGLLGEIVVGSTLQCRPHFGWRGHIELR